MYLLILAVYIRSHPISTHPLLISMGNVKYTYRHTCTRIACIIEKNMFFDSILRFSIYILQMACYKLLALKWFHRVGFLGSKCSHKAQRRPNVQFYSHTHAHNHANKHSHPLRKQTIYSISVANKRRCVVRCEILRTRRRMQKFLGRAHTCACNQKSRLKVVGRRRSFFLCRSFRVQHYARFLSGWRVLRCRCLVALCASTNSAEDNRV